jgi:putative cardiolipin synthase
MILTGCFYRELHACIQKFVFGHIARQANDMFDHFWNSEWVVSAENIETEPDAEFAQERWRDIQQQNRAAEELKTFGVEPEDWSDELAEVALELRIGTSFLDLAQEELLITNAYIIPGPRFIDFMQSLTGRGTRVRILTNSLESHDVPAVNMG